MDRDTLKDLDAVFKQVNTDVKKCRAGHQALVQLAAFNGSGDAMALTVAELEATAETLVKDARSFAKSVSEIKSEMGTHAALDSEEAVNG